MAKMSLRDTASVMVSANTSAAKGAAVIIAGDIINDRVVSMLEPRLPKSVQLMMAMQPELSKVLVANLAAGALIHFAPTNEKAQLAATAMIQSAMLDLAKSFNIQDMVNQLLDGIDVSALTAAVQSEED